MTEPTTTTSALREQLEAGGDRNNIFLLGFHIESLQHRVSKHLLRTIELEKKLVTANARIRALEDGHVACK